MRAKYDKAGQEKEACEMDTEEEPKPRQLS